MHIFVQTYRSVYGKQKSSGDPRCKWAKISNQSHKAFQRNEPSSVANTVSVTLPKRRQKVAKRFVASNKNFFAFMFSIAGEFLASSKNRLFCLLFEFSKSSNFYQSLWTACSKQKYSLKLISKPFSNLTAFYMDFWWRCWHKSGVLSIKIPPSWKICFLIE